jgi:hypothetical protein
MAQKEIRFVGGAAQSRAALAGKGLLTSAAVGFMHTTTSSSQYGSEKAT